MVKPPINGNGDNYRWQAIHGVLNVAMVILLGIFGWLGSNANSLLLRLNDSVVRLEARRESDIGELQRSRDIINQLQQDIIELKLKKP